VVKNEDLGFQAFCYDRVDDFDAIHLRHVYIEEDHVRFEFADDINGFGPIGRLPHDLDALFLAEDLGERFSI
jgi:hypothetical protein